MTILVSSLEGVAGIAAARAPSHVVSLLGRGGIMPDFDPPPGRRLRLVFNDIAEPTEGLTAPDETHIAALLSFLESWDRRLPLLIHCWAGVSRSTAAAYIAACLRDPAAEERVLADRLRAAAPFATPNPLMIALADRALDRNGRMAKAIAGIGRGADCAMGTPFEL